MQKYLLRYLSGVALALSLVSWGCGQLGDADVGPLGPAAVSQATGATTSAVYRPLRGSYTGGVRVDERVIQPTAGGNVGVAGTTLIVPAGAVAKPTLFSMRLAPVDSDGTTRLQMELHAYEADGRGGYTVDVGSKGFHKPVELRMNTEWVTEAFDPEQVRIVWMKPDGGQEALATTIGRDGRYTAQLGHFSDYAAATP